MDRKRLLDSLRKAGYKGKAELAEVKTFMAENGYGNETVDDAEGKQHKIDDVWAKAAALAIEPEAEPEAEDDPEEQPGTKAADDKTKTKGIKQHKPDGRGAKSKPHFNIGNGDVSYAKKRYDARVKMFQNGDLPAKSAPLYESADDAELAGAWWRKTLVFDVSGKTYAELENDTAIVGKAMSGDINTAGGVLVPTQFIPDVLWLTEGYGVARKISTVWTMTGDTLRCPRQTGLVTFAFRGQNGSMTAADIPTDQIELVAKEAYGYTQVSNELIADAAINVGDMISRSFAEGALKIEDQCYFLGDGSATYGNMSGLISKLPSGAYLNGSGSSWSALTEADIENCISKLENIQGGKLSIVCSRNFFVQVFQRLSAGAGGRTQAEFNTNNILGTAFAGADAQYQGIPVYFSQVMPTVTASATKSCYFGVFDTATKIGDRQGLKIDTSEHVAFASNAMVFRGIKRFDVNIHGDGRASTYGPITSLVTT